MEPTGIEFPKISEILTMTNKEFKSKYGHLAGAWRGVSVLKRNAMFNAGFYKYKAALPEIAKIRDGQGPDWLKEAAKQAYERLENKIVAKNEEFCGKDKRQWQMFIKEQQSISILSHAK